MKTKCLLLLGLVLLNFSLSYAHAQDEEMIFPESEETVMPTSGNASPPTIIDESDSSDVSDVEEYDG